MTGLRRRGSAKTRTRVITTAAPVTTPTAIAISGRYIRRSAPTSVAIGMMLEDGASVTKNHVPRNASAGRLSQATPVATTHATTTTAYGHVSRTATARGSP